MSPESIPPQIDLSQVTSAESGAVRACLLQYISRQTEAYRAWLANGVQMRLLPYDQSNGNGTSSLRYVLEETRGGQTVAFDGLFYRPEEGWNARPLPATAVMPQ